MTHFERTYLISRPNRIAISYANTSARESGITDLTEAF